MNVLLVFQLGVGLFALAAFFFLFRDISHNKLEMKTDKKNYVKYGIMAVPYMFLDCLGIGSYAPLMVTFKATKTIKDDLIPGTLNACCFFIATVETILYTTTIDVSPVTLFVLIGGATVGAFFGSKFVSKLDITKIRFAMGGALIVVALVMIAGNLNLMPTGGDAIALSPGKLAFATVIAVILGALMTIGIGIYAPIMALVYALGLSPLVAFPIMMGSCAFLMPTAAIGFIKSGKYDRKAALTINFVGLIGVAIAVFFVTSIPLVILKWLVSVVLFYTAVIMFRDARKGQLEKNQAKAAA
ncbi:MAG: sulfite exporter TauE/SafE family protein [Clostridiales bacterium]